MKRVGFVGWRGMVGSVLMGRMISEGDFKGFEPLFFSTSQVGRKGPDVGFEVPLVEDAYDTEKLSAMDIIVSCQGGGYTSKMHAELRKNGWSGYWIDAASTLRMEKDSIIVLDPVNQDMIERGLSGGIKDYIGGNCTVSLMLMAIGGLFEKDCIEWLTSMTYQAASGAGANNMRELVKQMQTIGNNAGTFLDDPDSSILDLDRNVADILLQPVFPIERFGAPLAASLIPWIDSAMENGQTREEWKGFAETNKIIGRTKNPIPIDGQCVRIGAMRCHSQAFTIQLKQDMPLDEIEGIISEHNQWVKLIPNEKEATLRELTPAKVTGGLDVPVGRLRKLTIKPGFITAFTVGDQLLWGAAEPIRRMLNIVLSYLN